MKKITIVCLILIALTTIAYKAAAGPILCCDAQNNVSHYIVEVDGATIMTTDDVTGVETEAMFPAVNHTDSDGKALHCFYDVGSLGEGDHTFRAKAVSAAVWESSGWSDPFSARRPTVASNLRLRK